MRKSNQVKGLYAVTDPLLIRDYEFGARVDEAIAGGARVVQYRDKRRDSGHRARAEELRQLTRNSGALLIINDDPELADAVDADGLHLGKDDVGLFKARKLMGKRLIGVSCYNRLDLAQQAQLEGADYVAFGSFFPTSTKSQTVHAEVELLRQSRKAIKIPIVAIGGITAQNGAPLVAAGADALAVASGLFGRNDVRAAASELNLLFAKE